MEDKYYLPKKEDLFIGYECETQVDPYPNWVHTIIEDENDFGYILDRTWAIRTPYLTKEQIEAEGWELINVLEHSEESHEFSWYQFKKGKYEVRWWGQPDYIEFHNSRSKEDLIYEGKCPSINEFRTICKLLGV